MVNRFSITKCPSYACKLLQSSMYSI